MLWRATRKEAYREWGWQMLRAWERFCRVGTGGYASLNSVLQARRPALLARLSSSALLLPGLSEVVDCHLSGQQ